MNRVTNENDRRLLLQKLRIAVRLQIRFWDACGEVSEILGDHGDDAVTLVEQVARERAGNELQLADLDSIQDGFRKINPTAAARELSQEMQHALLVDFLSAIGLQKKLLDAAHSLAKAFGGTRKEVLEIIRGFATCADTGMDLNERDLQLLLREPKAKDYIQVGGPLES